MNVHVLRNTVSRGVAIAALALSIAAAPVRAQNAPATVRLTLGDAVARALEASHRVGEGEAREEAARAAVSSREASGRPVVSALGGYVRTNHVDEYAITMPGAAPRVIYPDVPDNWRGRLDVQWPLYTSGRLPALARAAAADADAARADVTTVRSDIRLDATRAFWTFVMSQESVQVVEESLKRVESHLKDVRAQREVGLLAPNDVLSVEARRSRERVLLIEARNARDVAEADLRRVTGLPPETTIEIDAAAADVSGDVPDVPVLVAEARQRRTEREALVLRIGALGQRRTAIAAGLKPMVAVVGGADYARPNTRIFPRAAEWKPSFDVGINVAWNLWDGGRVKADVAEADASRRAAERRLAEFDRQLEFELRQRRLDLQAAHASIAAANDGVAAATEAHRVVADRFKAGLVGNTDVMDAQVALMAAHLDRTRTVTAARLAQARLDRALGR